MMRRLVLPLLLVAVVALLAGCGSQSASSATSDTTPPTVQSRTPAPGATNVDTYAPIKVVFDEAIDRSTLSTSTVSLATSGGASVSRTLSLSKHGTTLTVTPTTPPNVPTDLTLGLSSDITDTAGNHLVVPTKSDTWSLPAWQRPAGGQADQAKAFQYPYYPWARVATTSSGAIVTAWARLDASQTINIVVKRWDASSGSWTALGANGEVTSSGGADAPTLAIDAQDRPVVAWEETSNAHVKRWDPQGGSWTALGGGVDTASHANGRTSPALAVDAQDRPVIAYRHNATSGNRSIRVARWDAGTGSWVQLGSDLNLYTGTGADYPAIAIGAQDRPIVAWQETNPNTQSTDVYVKRWNPTQQAWQGMGGGWMVATSNADEVAPSLAVDSQGIPVVSWNAPDANGHPQTFVDRFDASTGWWGPLGNPISRVGTEAYADVGVDGAGRPVVAYQDALDIRASVWDAANARWKALGPLLDLNANDDAYDVGVATGGHGAPVAAWIEAGPGPDQLMVARWNGPT